MDYQHLLRPRTTRLVQEAGFLRRCISFIIDLLILDLIITAPFTSIFTAILSRAEDNMFAVHYTRAEIAAIILLFALVYAYFVLFEYLLGQTLGMMLVNTRIDGEYGLAKILLRNSFIIPLFPFILFWVIEPIAIIFWRRSVLEQLTGTRTVYARSVII